MNIKLVPSTIVETLDRNGALKIDDLYKRVGKRHGKLDESIFEGLLMEMEIQGLIRVYRMPRGKRRIELA